LQGALGEARPDSPCEDELAIGEVPHEQRADPVGPPTLPRQPASDHELLAPAVFDLQPRATAPPRLVTGAEPLGDKTFEAPLSRRLEQALARPVMSGRDL